LNNVDRYIKEKVGSCYEQQQERSSTTTTLWMHVSLSIYKKVLEEYKQIKEDCIPQLMRRWNDAVTAYGKALALNELELSLQLIQWTNLATTTTTTTTTAEKGG
ncbi:hypothetical protein FOZ62_020540, partial [Perkinsus olseni]